MRTTLATAAALALAAVPAFAQTTPHAPNPPPATTAGPAAQASQQDQNFLNQAVPANKAEIDAGRWMEQHGTDPAVKTFARWMVTDHTMAENMLNKALQGANLQPPTSSSQQEQTHLADLQRRHGADLDRSYIRQMVQDHQKAVQLFQQEAQSGQDTRIKGFAQELLPVLQQHLAAVEDLDHNLSATVAQHHRASSRL